MHRNRRKELRVRRRFSCQVRAGDVRYAGAILDLSHHGLFVQTRMQPRTKLRIPVDVSLRLPDSELAIATELVRQFRVPAALFTTAGGGLGLRIRSAPDAWRAFVESLSPNSLLSREPAPSTPRAKRAIVRCMRCGAPPLIGTHLCERCRREERRSA